MINGDDSLPQLLIKTPSLGIIQGEINPLVKNVHRFIGIPFAQPPIGTLRFKPPPCRFFLCKKLGKRRVCKKTPVTAGCS
jgi:hypothetical protein